MSLLQHRLDLVAASDRIPLAGLVRGVEKESLRVTPGGKLAQTPHPQPLGSALTHQCITTDYSEALLEFITFPSTSTEAVLTKLQDIHSFVYQHLGDELLWVHSMPCSLGQDADIPVGYYGTSNVGRMKSIYRVGLGHRYGRLMQTIAGTHYNFSAPDSLWELLFHDENAMGSMQDFVTDKYFALIRNFRRWFWLLLYLFGAAPAVCKSFVRNRQHRLEPLNGDTHTLTTPYATSLRMGDLGYQSKAQESLIICYNSLPAYIETLHSALTIPYENYQAIGVRGKNGDYQQLNDNLLQLENEFYSTIRPKRATLSGEAPLAALKERGVEYVEVRCLDINPFSPVGITAEQMHFIDTFLVTCLLEESPPSDEKEYCDIRENQRLTVYQGRDPNLKLHCNGGLKSLRDWAQELFEKMQPVADLLDQQQSASCHRDSLAMFKPALADATQTYSGRLIQEMTESGKSYFQTALAHAVQHSQWFRQHPLPAEKITHFEYLAKQSMEEQRYVEDGDRVTLDEYIDHYFQQYQNLR
ncbi:MAG: glutamate--cysteine ligase [bacterium]